MYFDFDFGDFSSESSVDFDSDFDPEKVLIRARECAYGDHDEECPLDESTLLLHEITTLAAMTTTGSNKRSSNSKSIENIKT